MTLCDADHRLLNSCWCVWRRGDSCDARKTGHIIWNFCKNLPCLMTVKWGKVPHVVWEAKTKRKPWMKSETWLYTDNPKRYSHCSKMYSHRFEFRPLSPDFIAGRFSFCGNTRPSNRFRSAHRYWVQTRSNSMLRVWLSFHWKSSFQWSLEKSSSITCIELSCGCSGWSQQQWLGYISTSNDLWWFAFSFFQFQQRPTQSIELLLVCTQ